MIQKLGLLVIVIIALGTTLSTTAIQAKPTYALVRELGEAFHIHINPRSENVPIATSGNNAYLVWSSNKTGNDEVMFRASTDNGKMFGDKINLSNSTKADSQDAQIDTFGNNDSNVIVTWWERNATNNDPVLKISTDSGKTFGQILKLSTNGTIGNGSGG
jgi:hypothetical protein